MDRCRQFFLQGILIFFVISVASAEPTEWAVRGKVLERGTRKPLEGVTVYLLERETDTAVSERDGSFTLTLRARGEFSLVAVGIGYKKSEPLKISVGGEEEPEEVILYLDPVYSMMEVVVQADRNLDKTAKTVISGKELASVPGSAGDPLRGMQALPGITTSNDASSNPAIRGSSPENNTYYVDFLPVGYLFHMGGLESVLNADLVEDFNIYSSSFGPEFADVTGGVIDVKLRNPRKDRIGGKLNVSTLEADALIEGPVAANQSFYAAARRSYFDLILPKSAFEGEGAKVRQIPQYYDYQGKYVWNLSDDHTLIFQSSGANDALKITLTSDSDAVKHDPILAGDINFSESYNTEGIVLTSKISPRVNNKFGISYLNTSVKENLTQLGHLSIDTNDMFVRDHLSVATGEHNEVLFGADYNITSVKLNLDVPKVVPSPWNPDTHYTGAERFVSTQRITANSWGLAVKDRWKIVDPLTLVIGERTSHEDYFGKTVVEPRLGAEYYVTKDTLITAGWGKYHQFPMGYQVLEGFGNPHLDYEKADHYDAGVEQQIADGWSVKVDEYYKKLYNLVIPHQPENYINGGSGKAYGTEVLIKKNLTTDWWGWLSVSYTKTERHNDVTGEKFPFSYDQPLIVNIVYVWKITPKWTFGAKWRYQSGAPFTPVIDKYTDTTGTIRPIYGEIGSARLPAYHRLDLRLSAEVWSGMQQVQLYVDLINAYNHQNISGYDYNADYTSRKPITELPLMPAFGVQVAF